VYELSLLGLVKRKVFFSGEPSAYFCVTPSALEGQSESPPLLVVKFPPESFRGRFIIHPFCLSLVMMGQLFGVHVDQTIGALD